MSASVQLHSTSEVARRLGVSTKTVLKYIADGDLRAVNLATRDAKGRATWRIRDDDLAKFQNARTAGRKSA
jgi:excisionase family DNA binding protein